MATAKGRELADKLSPAIGTTTEILDLCSRIARAATTHGVYAERDCNYGLTDIEAEKVERIERVITTLVGDLPHTDDGPFGVLFQGDPRGHTVKLTAPGEWEHLYDDWGRTGICVPQ